MITLAELAAILQADVLGDEAIAVARPTEPALAGPDDLALAMSPGYATALAESAARAAIVWPGADWQAMGLAGAIEVPRARLAMSHLTQAFDTRPSAQGIHPTAVVDPTAQIAASASVGAFCVIGRNTVVGADCRIESHVSVGEGCEIGVGAWLHSGVRLGRSVILGRGVILHPNVVVGADGFSFVTERPSNEERAIKTMGRTPLDPPADATRHRIHSLGGVIIGNDVEIGANSTVDAGTVRPTRVGDGTKIDNLVQVGHNVTVGRDCVLCAQAAVAGSARLGDRVVMGGKSGIRDNIMVGCDVVLGGAAIVLGPVADGQFLMGYPALPMPEHRAREKALRRLAQGDHHKAVSNTSQSD